MAMRSTQLDGIANAQPETCLEPRREAMQHSQARSSRCLCSLDLSPPRGTEKRGPRSEACHASEWLCLELLSIILGQVEERFTSLLVAVLMRRSGAIYADRALSKLYT